MGAVEVKKGRKDEHRREIKSNSNSRRSKMLMIRVGRLLLL
jgi:hypothetical protein